MGVSITAAGLVATVITISYSYTPISPNPNLYYMKGWCLLLSDCKGLLGLLAYVIFTGLN